MNVSSLIERAKYLIRPVYWKLMDIAESIILPGLSFYMSSNFKSSDRVTILYKSVLFHFFRQFVETKYEINVVISSKACERMWIPIVLHLMRRISLEKQQIKVNLIFVNPANQSLVDKLVSYGCHVENQFSLIKSCLQPQNKLVLLCLDHRLRYELHKYGVDTADILRKFSVKTMSIQHGGTREDSIRELASSASDIVLIWGEKVFRELVNKYQVNPSKIRVVGNPLHDRIKLLDREEIHSKILKYYPSFYDNLLNKKVVLLATCLHTEYREYRQEVDMYVEYIKYIYDSLDFSKVFLIIKMHPYDNTEDNLYQQTIPKNLLNSQSILIIDSNVDDLDVYSLLFASELLITRCSTVAEEALLMQKKVIAFDLEENGPSKYYKHLEEYGNYETVYANPNALSNAVSKSLFSKLSSFDCKYRYDIEEDVTYALDGKSTDRAANEILGQLLE